ncbi:TIGR03364 family FAD-dependent oxidoreductase [Gordonia alkaliphila]|uniref:TIGR03364 family FAD-dependent oxidoreductase n=1 Tax=Gordonia alkaliphila TaxID=1053547 RepID=UPI001FF53B35|nr:TIGR03364 family FAD-dependent oxidoreductase [Gordonia alkaliphila]MCK0440643.1 TIGR03364 family FAD-dependent oxidoreductase [Gordonia alkaliphila]
MNNECDVLVVGAGVLGLGHALAALEQGQRVIVLEREHRIVGASVRNFGHVGATVQSGELRDLALGARQRWLSVADAAGIEARREGAGLAVARRTDELEVLTELAGSRDSVRLLTPAQVVDRLGGAGADDIVGGADLGDDLRVDPRTTVPRLAAWVDAQDGAEIRWNTAYLGAEPVGDGVRVRTSRGEIRARRVFVCVGHDLDRVAPTVAADAGVQRCGLSMMLTEDPGFRVAPAVLTATSLLRYGAFADTAAAAVLRERLSAERPDLIAADTNIMFTQRPDGGLLIGDSHLLDDSLDPFLDEAVFDLLHREVETVLGRRLAIRQRWQGIYAARPDGPYLVAELAPGVTACSVTTGVGMTVGLELAARTVAAVPA